MLWDKFDEGAREAGKDPIGDAEAAPAPHVVGARPTRRRSTTRSSSGRTAACPSPKQDIRNPEDFAAMAKLVRPEDFENRDPHQRRPRGAHAPTSSSYVDMGFDEIHLHNVGRNQAEFIEVFGREVLPKLRPAKAPVAATT